jgi:oligopeptide/dipeptide ABC transporter ATP-binding protein
MVNENKNIVEKQPLVEAEHLKMYFTIPGKGMLHAVDDVSFAIYPGETLGLVGESGCGKSTVGNVIMRLLTATAGQLLFRGQNVFATKGRHSLAYRKKMQIIFQDPYSSLNPKKTIKSILSEAYQIHNMGRGAQLERLIDELCDLIAFPKNLLNHYPHELDGGMRQVVGIGRALSLSPEFIVCDEPVSSLDVSVQARIINMMMDVQKSLHVSYLFISHDLSVVRHISKRIAVMYLGQIVEVADTDTIFNNVQHPYSIALLSAIPLINTDKKVSRIVLKGDVPSPMNPKPGCRFAPRCWMAEASCHDQNPSLKEMEPGHWVACHFAHKSRERMKSAVTTSID